MTIVYSECGPEDTNNDQNTVLPRLIAHNPPCNHNRDGTLCDICREIAEIESQIETLHSRLEELHAKHRTLRTKRNDFNIITKFPYDLASDIFLLCLPIERTFYPVFESPCTGFSTPRLPLMLGAVCHSWRHLVHSIPRLWSTLSINIYKRNLQHISHRLQCSGSTPLSVHLHALDVKDANHDSAYILDVILLLKQNVRRMALLCLDLPCHVMAMVLSHFSNALSILKGLHIHFSRCELRHGGTCLQSHDFINSINPPSPHKVFVTAYSKMEMQLVWDDVRFLSLTASFQESHSLIGEAFSLLSKGKRLQMVDLDLDYGVDALGPPTGMMVTQNSIRNLRLFFTPLSLLSHTTMPHLESLTLWDNIRDSRNHIVPFLQRSACPLKTLDWKLIGAPPPKQALIDVFRWMPKVEQLYLNVNSLTGLDPERHIVPFLENLVVPSHDAQSLHGHSRGTLLPLLQKFVYAGRVIYAPPSLFLDIAETRSGTFPASEGPPLEELYIYYFQQRMEEDSEDLEPRQLTGTDSQRFLQLNAAGKQFSFLEWNPECDRVTNNFSHYRD